MAVEEIRAFTPAHAAELDLAITSYGTLLRLPVLTEIDWRLVILDEAQAIRNPHTKQTRAAKTLKAEARIALTGTPVENSLGDLWSIFDFINPGSSAPPGNSPATPNTSPNERTIPTVRCGSWCVPTSCGA